MIEKLDEIDRHVLSALQEDAGQSLDALAEQVHLSRNACWRRVKRLEETGVLEKRVALVAPDAVGLGLQVFVLIKTRHHTAEWLGEFRRAVSLMPEVVGAHRLSGELDYVLRVRVADVAAYDAFYQRLIAKVPIDDVSASFVMEDLKDTTALPV